MLNVALTAIPLVAAVVGYFVWAFGTRANPLPIWNPILLVAGFVIFWSFSFLAFHRVKIERDNAKAALSRQSKLMPLSNRDELLRAITEARIATIEFAEVVNGLRQWDKSNPNRVNVEAIDTVNNAQQRQNKAYEAMEKEILVAGNDYEPILRPLYLFMQSSAVLNASPTENKGTLLTYKSKLEKVITETRNKIDQLNPQVSHKESPQT